MDHRALGVELYNACWPLLDKERTADEDAALVHQAHASLHHWAQVGTRQNLARGEYLCSRVYAAVGRPEPALWHAERCLQLAQEYGDWDVMAAHEVLARAHLTAGDTGSARAAIDAARAVPVADDEDRAVIEKDLAELEARLEEP